jgi:hypothetical protein
MLLKKLLLGLGLLCLLVSCERDETFIQDDNQEFCPVNFRYRSNEISTLNCTGLPFRTADPKIVREPSGFVFSQDLFDANAPYFSWIDTLDQFQAYHFLKRASRVRFDFDKINMSPGTKIVLFAGPTIVFPPSSTYWESSDAQDGKNHLVETFIERGLDSIYVLNFKIKGVLQALDTKTINLDKGVLEMEVRSNGDLTLSAGYTVAGAPPVNRILGFTNDPEILSILNENPFLGIGFYSTITSCVIKNIQIRPTFYEYINNENTSQNVSENFNCNTIWLP